MAALRIAIYGKGGIGKSTTSANLAAALADSGYRVLQVGCDPKADSTMLLTHGSRVPTILDAVRSGGEIHLEDIVKVGYGGVLCAEAGGPTPGVGCAGRGVIVALDKLEELRAYEVYNPDVVIYDVLGDVVCGGFAMPLRGVYTDTVYIVTSGEMMAMYAASNIAHAVRGFAGRGYARLGGLILNRRNVKDEREQVERLATEISSELFFDIPRCLEIQDAENAGQTVVEFMPDSEISRLYRELAVRIMEECRS